MIKQLKGRKNRETAQKLRANTSGREADQNKSEIYRNHKQTAAFEGAQKHFI